jgi:hypothetical protein
MIIGEVEIIDPICMTNETVFFGREKLSSGGASRARNG